MKVIFFARVQDRRLLDLLEFYREDIEILRDAGYEVEVHHRAWSAMTASGDVLFAWWWHTALPVLLAQRLRGTRVVCTGAVDFRNRLVSRRRQGARWLLTWLGVRLAHANVAVSDFEREDLLRLRRKNTSTIQHSVDLDYYHPGALTPHPSAVLIAQINPASVRRKGVDVAVAAAELVAQVFPDFKLNLIGPADENGSAWLRAHLRPDGPVLYAGQLSRQDKAAALREAWLCLQPSQYEGFGLSVVEAMASGCFPIVSPGGALPEVVGSSGAVVDANARSVADMIIEVLNRHDLPELQAAARSRSAVFSRAARRSKILVLLRAISQDCTPHQSP